MTRFNKMVMAGMMLFLLSILGCGEYTGPGSDNVSFAGMYFSLDKVIPKDVGSATYDIDVIQDLCDVGPPPKYEKFTDATMALTFNYFKAPACENNVCPAIYIKSYKVVFFSNAYGAVPLDPLAANIWLHMLPGENQTMDGLIMMPISTKTAFIDRGGDFMAEPQYQIKVTVKGVTEFGEEFETSGYTYILVADWDNC